MEVEPGTNLSDVNWQLAYDRADASELSLGLGNGLPQLSPAAVDLVDLPLVHIEAFLLKLQQHLVPHRLGLTDLIPHHPKTEKSLSPWRQLRGEQPQTAQQTPRMGKLRRTLSSRSSESHGWSCCWWPFTALPIARSNLQGRPKTKSDDVAGNQEDRRRWAP